MDNDPPVNEASDNVENAELLQALNVEVVEEAQNVAPTPGLQQEDVRSR